MKVFTVILVVVLGLCVVATAPSSADVPKPRGPQGLPGPGPVSPPPVAEPQDVVLPASDGGLSPYAIMLLSLGGILTLTGVGYVVTRATLAATTSSHDDV